MALSTSTHFRDLEQQNPEQQRDVVLFSRQQDTDGLCGDPITFPYVDAEGRILQLWKSQQGYFGSVEDEGGSSRVPACHIFNLLSNESSSSFLPRVEKLGLRAWDIVYIAQTNMMYVLPHLQAAGKDGQNLFNVDSQRLKHVFNHKDGHLVDTSHNRRLLQRVVDNPGAYKGTDRHGNAIYLQRTTQGQVWVKVREQEGTIEDGGLSRHDRPNTFNQTRQELMTWKTRFMSVSPRDRQRMMTDAGADQIRRQAALVKSVRPEERIREGTKPGEPHRDGGGDGGRPNKPPPPFGLTGKSFKEAVQQNRLAESYNASHPDKQIVQRGSAGGTIGGVGNEVGIIEGLFTSLKDLEEARHIFCIPSLDGKPPFSNAELRQIIRELTVGIYVYDTIPFFSLHFNQDSNLYPVMHPVYQNTLVGRVISLLDYHMKGFLNGVLFEEAFLEKWQGSKTQGNYYEKCA